MKFLLLLISFFVGVALPVFSQETEENRCDYLRIAFYNVENYFDPIKDSLSHDEDFTPEGAMHWTFSRFNTKKNHIYKTLAALGEWCPPSIIGLAEVENDRVLNELCVNTPLRKYHYQYVHFESPDSRGIDVALLYKKNDFLPIESKPISILFPNDSAKTRDILYVKGLISQKDTFHFFVVHLPSKLSGSIGEQRREFAGKVLKMSVDSILQQNSRASIVIMGDFNEEPADMISSKVLDAANDSASLPAKSLLNLTANAKGEQGSYKYQGQWAIIDQMIVSKSLYQEKEWCIKGKTAFIFSAPFLLEEDKIDAGKKPFRTYAYRTYLGGFSDHLPVYFDLQKCKD